MLYHSLLDNGVIDDLKAKAASLNGISASTSEGTEYIRSNKSWYPYRRYNDWMFDLNSKIDTVRQLTCMFDTYNQGYLLALTDSTYLGRNFYRFKNRDNIYIVMCNKFAIGSNKGVLNDGYIYSYDLVNFYYVPMVQGISSYPYERTANSLYSDDHDKLLLVRSHGKDLHHYYLGSFISNEKMEWTRYQNSSYSDNPEGGIYSKTIQKFILSLGGVSPASKRFSLYLIDPITGAMETVYNSSLKAVRLFIENKEHTKIYAFNRDDSDVYESTDGKTWIKSSINIPYRVMAAYYVEKEDLYVFFTKDRIIQTANKKQYVYTSKDLVTFEQSSVYIERISSTYDLYSDPTFRTLVYIDHLDIYMILDSTQALSSMRFYYSFDGCKTWKYGYFTLQHNNINTPIYDEYRKQLVLGTSHGIELLPFA